MYQRNLFLIQVEHANKLSHSSWPQEKRLAIILLDNLFEISIMKKVNHELYMDSSYGEDMISSKKRNQVLSSYSEMLKFSQARDCISQSEYTCLSFVHQVRNKSYHNHYIQNEMNVEIALLIACDFIRSSPNKWLSAFGVGFTSDLSIRERYFKTDLSSFLSIDKQFEEQVQKILTFGKKRKLTIQKMLEILVAGEIKKVQKDVDELKEAISNQVGFNEVFGHHQKLGFIEFTGLEKASASNQLLLILAFYEVVSINQDELLDVKDKKERQKLFRNRIRERISKKPKYPLKLVQEFKVDNLMYDKLSLSSAIEKSQVLLAQIRMLAIASSMAYGTLSDWYEYMYELHAGK